MQSFQSDNKDFELNSEVSDKRGKRNNTDKSRTKETKRKKTQ